MTYSRFSRSPGAVAVALVLCTGSQARAATERQDAKASSPPPPTPGAVALLANKPDSDAIVKLRGALGSDDPVVRAVAARLAGVSKILSLVPDLGAALEREQDEAAAAEQARALLFFDTPATRATVERLVPRAGSLAIRVQVEWLARMQPELLPDRMDDLLRPVDAASRDGFAPLVALAIKRKPEARERLLRAWLRVSTGSSWRSVLDTLGGETDADTPVFRQALMSDDAAIRRETVWAIVTKRARGLLFSASTLDAALPVAQDDSAVQATATWEVFGRELIARSYRQAQTPDRAGLVKAEAARYRVDARSLLSLKEITTAERSALREALGENQPAKNAPLEKAAQEPNPPRGQSTMRTGTLPWPGVSLDVLKTAGCSVSDTPRFGAYEVTYRPDGRPAQIRLDARGLPQGCEPALAAFARLSLADPKRDIVEGETQWVIVPVYNEFLACEAGRPAGPGGHGPVNEISAGRIEQPRKTRDVRPVYPVVAQQNRVQGVVIVEAVISATGCVTSIAVLRSVHPLLDFAAVQAVTGWQFTPTRVDGQPVPVIMTVSVNFELR